MTVSPAPLEEQFIASPRRERTLWSDAMRRFSRNWLAMVGLAIVGIFMFMAIFANFVAPWPYDYSVLNEALQFPSAQHLLGTDAVGHDFLSTMIYGARTSLGIALAVMFMAFAIGMPMGALAGWRGGTLDWIVMRFVEVMTAFPSVMFAMFILGILGGGPTNVILAIGVTSWIEVCRLTRAQVISLRGREFVTASRACGSNEVFILARHLLPMALPTLMVMLALGIPTVIFAEAGLSFLGLGINDPIPSWGKMVGDNFGYIRVYTFLGAFPTLAIALAMLGFNFVGDGLRDALDPTMVH
jgi:oligopeptide transport system permease protein